MKNMDEHERIGAQIEKRMRDLEFGRKEILNMDIEYIQWICWDFLKAYEWGDTQKCGKIVSILITLSHNKEEIPTLEEYFGGEKIARYKGTIHIDKASEWVVYISEMIKAKTDHRVKPTPIN